MALIPAIPASLLALAYLGILLIGAKAGEEVFRRLGLVPFVGAIFIGIVIGPGVLGAVTVVPGIALFVSLGIDFLLFLSGAEEFESTRLKSMFSRKGSTLVSLLQFGLRFTAIFVISYFLFHQVIPAMVVGIVAGMSSAGPLTRLLMDTGLTRTDEGTAIFSQVLVIEISAVVLFSFVYDLAGVAVTLLSVLTVGGELVVAILSIIAFGRFVMVPLLEKVDSHFESREALFAIIVSIVLIAGFVGQATGFNSAIVALFLGLLSQRFLAARPVLMEKLHAITYGFFEPMFFAGLGLYFVRVTPSLIILGVSIFGAALALDAVVGASSANYFGVNRWRNAFGTCVNGGVDAALLLSALGAGVILISGYIYSAAAIAIALLSLTAPLLFRLRANLVPFDRESGTKEIVKQHLRTLTAAEICKTLPTVAVRDYDSVMQAVKTLSGLDALAAVVLDNTDQPVATIILSDVMTLGTKEMSRLKVVEAPLAEPVTVVEEEPALRLAGIFKETNIPVIAVVNKDGRLVGTILEREILRRLVDSLGERGQQ